MGPVMWFGIAIVLFLALCVGMVVYALLTIGPLVAGIMLLFFIAALGPMTEAL